MRAAQPRQSQARPAHHIIEEKTDPVTGQKSLGGSSWREDTRNLQNKFDKLANNPDTYYKNRNHYYNLANQLEVDIGQEDAQHLELDKLEERLPGDREFAINQGNKARIPKGPGASQSAIEDKSISKADAARRGYIPPR
jgi:hypothetical protein